MSSSDRFHLLSTQYLQEKKQWEREWSQFQSQLQSNENRISEQESRLQALQSDLANSENRLRFVQEQHETEIKEKTTTTSNELFTVQEKNLQLAQLLRQQKSYTEKVLATAKSNHSQLQEQQTRFSLRLDGASRERDTEKERADVLDVQRIELEHQNATQADKIVEAGRIQASSTSQMEALRQTSSGTISQLHEELESIRQQWLRNDSKTRELENAHKIAMESLSLQLNETMDRTSREHQIHQKSLNHHDQQFRDLQSRLDAALQEVQDWKHDSRQHQLQIRDFQHRNVEAEQEFDQLKSHVAALKLELEAKDARHQQEIMKMEQKLSMAKSEAIKLNDELRQNLDVNRIDKTRELESSRQQWSDEMDSLRERFDTEVYSMRHQLEKRSREVSMLRASNEVSNQEHNAAVVASQKELESTRAVSDGKASSYTSTLKIVQSKLSSLQATLLATQDQLNALIESDATLRLRLQERDRTVSELESKCDVCERLIQDFKKAESMQTQKYRNLTASMENRLQELKDSLQLKNQSVSNLKAQLDDAQQRLLKEKNAHGVRRTL